MNAAHFLSVALAVAIASGCSSTPPVQLAAASKSPFESAVFSGETTRLAQPTPGSESLRAFYQGGSGFVSIASVRETVENIATKHCARQDQAVRLLEETTAKPPYIFGNFPRVEWVFECQARPSASPQRNSPSDKLGQIERLKKLFDAGALTQQEFDLEKAKILKAE